MISEEGGATTTSCGEIIVILEAQNTAHMEKPSLVFEISAQSGGEKKTPQPPRHGSVRLGSGSTEAY